MGYREVQCRGAATGGRHGAADALGGSGVGAAGVPEVPAHHEAAALDAGPLSLP